MTRLRLLQLATASQGGGAERVARTLHDRWRALGHDAHLVVGRGTTDDRIRVLLDDGPAAHADRQLARASKAAGLQGVGRPFAARALAEVADEHWDAVVVHNLHGDWLNLGALRAFTDVRPHLVLHDRWLLAGHCAHPMGCERWRIGCGSCPDLTIYPAVRRDATAANLRLKSRVLHEADPVLVTLGPWMDSLLADSHLAALPRVRARVPVDLTGLGDVDRDEARRSLGIDRSAPTVLFPSTLDTDGFKDAQLLLAALAKLGDDAPHLLANEGGRLQPPSNSTLLPRASAADMATRYAAADVVANVSHAETAPLVPIEAAAAGVPCVLTDVGDSRHHAGPGGELVMPGNSGALADALRQALDDDVPRDQLRSWASAHDATDVAVQWLELLGVSA